MVYALVRVTFQDFETWKAAFTAAGELRQEHTSKGVRVFRSPDNPNQVLILGEYEELSRAQDLFKTDRFREALKRAGVTAPPEVTYLDEVLKLPA
jgi:hypothetical protein